MVVQQTKLTKEILESYKSKTQFLNATIKKDKANDINLLLSEWWMEVLYIFIYWVIL